MSSLRSRILFILPLLGLTDAIAFRAPAATLTQNDYESVMPDPTPGVDINTIARLQRRATTSYSDDSEYSDESWTWSFYETTAQAYLSGSPNVCGWVEGNLDNYAIECGSDYSCVFHTPDAGKYPGVAGCCAGTDCKFETTCVNYTQYTATPDLFSSAGAFTLFCSDSEAPACVTWTYPDQTITDFGCDITEGISKVYTSATPGSITASVETIESVWLSTVDDDFLSTYEASWSSVSGATSAQAATVGHVTSQAAAHAATRATSNHATATAGSSHSSSSSSSSSTSTGAIAGGVVGGVVGAAAVGAVAMFYFMRRRNAKRVDDENLSPRGQGGYQSVPAGQPHNYEMQPSSEMGSGEQESKVSEAPGNVPSERAHEMESSTDRAHEMDSADPREFVAELPADYVVAQKGTSTDYDTKNA